MLVLESTPENHEGREKKLWAIVLSSLQEHNILSSKSLADIAGLDFF